MTELEFENIMTNDIKIIEHKLLSFIPNAKDDQDIVADAMIYSLKNGGKRIRPILTLEFCKAVSGTRNDSCISLACAIEYIHTYSLIHDDLPCMDNDDMRRGMPSCHKEFGDDIALLAGDALLTHAFEIIAQSDLSDAQKVKATLLLSQNAGIGGMIGGQVIDLIYEKKDNPTVKELINTYRMKTGALISAACLLGCICSDANEKQLTAASKFAYSLGIAFQIQDDILDIIGDEETLGKPVGSDEKNNKTTFANIVGIEKAKETVKILTARAIKQLDVFETPDFIVHLAETLTQRNK